MTQLNINISGIEEVKEYINTKDKKIKQAINDGLNDAGNHVEGEVVASISGQRSELRSVDTGRFMSSVKKGAVQNNGVEISSNVEYSTHLEFGTSRFRGRYHFTNTANREKNNVKKIIQTSIQNTV